MLSVPVAVTCLRCISVIAERYYEIQSQYKTHSLFDYQIFVQHLNRRRMRNAVNVLLLTGVTTC